MREVVFTLVSNTNGCVLFANVLLRDFVQGVCVELLPVQEFGAHSACVTCVEFSPVDSRVFATSSRDGSVRLWSLSKDGKTTSPLHTLPRGHTDVVSSLAWLPDGSSLVSASWDRTIRKWDGHTGQCVFASEAVHSDWVYAVACAPNGRHVVTGGVDCCLYVWNTSSGGVVMGPLTGHTSAVMAVTYSPHGRHFLSGSEDGSILVWDSNSGMQLFGPLTAHSNWIRSISYHPSGETFVTCSFDKTIRIWNAKTFTTVHVVCRAHDDWTRSVQCSVDGRFVLSASEDGTLKVWDVIRGECVNDAAEHGTSVSWAVFSPDVRRVVSGGAYGSVRVWEVKVIGNFTCECSLE